MGKFYFSSLRSLGKTPKAEIRNAGEIKSLIHIDEALWTSTWADIKYINFDKMFLRYLDADNDGLILCNEVKNAIKWLDSIFMNWEGIINRSDKLNRKFINNASINGKKLNKILDDLYCKLDYKQDDNLTLKDIQTYKHITEQTPISEEGVILREAADDYLIKDMISDLIDSIGGAEHPSGESGINKSKLWEFTKEINDYIAWKGQLFDENKNLNEDILPLGHDTGRGFEIFKKVRDKIDQYFAKCNILIYDNRFYDNYFELSEKEMNMDLNDKETVRQYLLDALISKPRTDGELVFSECSNIMYSEALSLLKEIVIDKIFKDKRENLTFNDWQYIKELFIPYDNWLSSKKGDRVSNIDDDKLKSYLDPDIIDAIINIIDESTKTEELMDEIRLIEKLMLFQRWILDFINNFVSFPYLYDPGKRAIFEMGTLIMDGKRFNLSVRVNDINMHKNISQFSNFYIIYCSVHKKDQLLYNIAVPLTSWTNGNIYIGKPCMFKDVHNNEYEARIIDIIENPVSFIETMTHPFKKILQIINNKIDEFGRSSEEKLLETISSSDTYKTQKEEGSSIAEEQKKQSVLGVLAGGGIAFAAIGSSLAFITKTLSQLSLMTIIGSILGALLLFMLPIIITGIIKLRKRDLNPLLEASGWAINTKMRLTRKQARFFTKKPRYKRKLFFSQNK